MAQQRDWATLDTERSLPFGGVAVASKAKHSEGNMRNTKANGVYSRRLWELGVKQRFMKSPDRKVKMNEAMEVFRQSNGDVTKAYYAKMNTLGLNGQLAVALFRAQKRSSAAKKYRRGAWRRDAYDVKNWSLSEVCRILDSMTAFEVAPRWGWKRDPETKGYEWVLYVDLPTGQCSFHSPERLNGPDYEGDWDGIRMSAERICRYCDLVSQG